MDLATAAKDINQMVADTLPALIAKAEAASCYKSLFTRRQSRLALEVVKHFSPDYERRDDEYVWHGHHQARGLKVPLFLDEDIRTTAPSAGKVSDAADVVKGLANALLMKREEDAAAVFNNALAYDPTMGGDGVSLCSDKHPHAKGTWSNKGSAKLSKDTLRDILGWLKNGGLVDSQGIPIRSQGGLLIVHPALEADAVRALASLGDDFKYMQRAPVSWDFLDNDQAWFIKTSIDGLTWFEREPLEVVAGVDALHDAVEVAAYERRSFSCLDPRAIYGSFPA